VANVATPAGAAEVFVARVTAVTDGDTLWVAPEEGGTPRKLRLEGIDAPEICQSGGALARDALRRLVAHQRVWVSVRAHDDYGRGLARIHLGNQDIGAAMVRGGQAWSYRWRSSLGPYAAEESAARQARIGLFSAIAPELPRDFRQRHGSCYPEK
jgi:endonuclease YncB( thermonuclease family)